MSDALSITISVISLFVGVLLDRLVNMIIEKAHKRRIMINNAKSLANIPKYNPSDDEILVIRQWNAVDRLDDIKTRITYNGNRAYDRIKPTITSRFISAPEEWEMLYSEELKKEKKRTGIVSYVTSISLDHKDTKNGNRMDIEVSSCDYLGHHVNSKYLARHPQDWERIKEVIIKGELESYFSSAMPGNVFVNFILINGQTNHVLAIKRSNQELNARNIWALGGFETMNDISNVSNGSEELKLKGIVYRGLREELAIEKNEVSQMEISSLSFVKHLGIMVTALVRVDIKDDDGQHTMTEGGLIQRVLAQSESGYEHNGFLWLPISLKDMKDYIENDTGYYKEVLQSYNGKRKTDNGQKETWISYAKLQMYEIWRNHESIDLEL